MAKDAILVDNSLRETQELMEAINHLNASRAILDQFALELAHWQDGTDYTFIAERFGATELDGVTPIDGQLIYDTLTTAASDLRSGTLLALMSRVVPKA